MKNYICSHIIILAVTLKPVEFPQASMQIPIGQNRKRGRPNKTKKALVRQNEINSLSPHSSQTIWASNNKIFLIINFGLHN